MAASLTQGIENIDEGAVFSLQEGNIPNNTESNVPSSSQDLKCDSSTQISGELWEELKSRTPVQACLEFADASKVKQAIIKVMGNNKGNFPASTKADDIFKEIQELDFNASQKNSAVVEISDKGHKDDGAPHEVHITYNCFDCGTEGVKPVVKIL